MGPTGDPTGPPALPARALRAVGTASTHRPLLVVAAGDRLDHTASGTGRSELATPTPRTHPSGIRTGQWPAGPCTHHAGRLGQVRAGSAQRFDQSTNYRRRADRQRIRVGRQRLDQAARDSGMSQHGIHRVSQLPAG